MVINPPSSDPRFIDAVKTLEIAQKAPVAAIFTPGDWHHFHVPTWADAWPDAKVYVASERVLVKQPTLRNRKNVMVVNREDPAVPELASSCTLLPWLGSQQPPWILGGDASGSDRVEHLVLHTASRSLFITDHLMNPDMSSDKVITPNTGGFSIQPGNDEAAASSAQRVLDAAPLRLIFSHGPPEHCVVGDGTEQAWDGIQTQLRTAYAFFGIPPQKDPV